MIFKVGVAVMLLIGLLMSGGGAFLVLDARKLVTEGVRVQGEVTRIVRQKCQENSTDRRGRTQVGWGECLYPVVSFPLLEGGTHVFESSRTISSDEYTVGQQVPVIYLASDPAPVDAQIATPDIDDYWGAGLFLLILGSVFTLLPAGALLQLFRLDARAVRRTRERAAQAEEQARRRAAQLASSPPRDRRIEAKVIEISQLRRDDATGKYMLKAVAQWRDPALEEMHRVESETMAFDPAVFASVRKLPGWAAPTDAMVREVLLGARVFVRVHPDGPAHYEPELIRIPGIGPVAG